LSKINEGGKNMEDWTMDELRSCDNELKLELLEIDYVKGGDDEE
jgi:hypothetical protein